MYHYSDFSLGSVNARTVEATCIFPNDGPAVSCSAGRLCALSVSLYVVFAFDVHFPFSLHRTTGFSICRILLCWLVCVSRSFDACSLPCLFGCRAANEIHRRLACAVDALLFVLVAVARGNKNALYVTHITLIAANKQSRSSCLCLYCSLSFWPVFLPQSKVSVEIAKMCLARSTYFGS
jgi:hypothetical protein